MQVDPALGFVLLGLATAAVAGILVRLRVSSGLRDTLDDHWQMNPWTGALRRAGIA